MAEAPIAMASAVIVPEMEAKAGQTPSHQKRRQSSVSSQDSKRRRLSYDNGAPSRSAEIKCPVSPTDRKRDRVKEGRLEERKRGQRLFGALLGTLSQSSSSTAQKRRADIEDKQRSKLKAQNEEETERRKEKIEALTRLRRKEQIRFERESMKIRHSNLLAQAHFLHTTAEPKLLYRPWELLSKDADQINAQLVGAKQTIDEERRESGVKLSPDPHKINRENAADGNNDTSAAKPQDQNQSKDVDAMLMEKSSVNGTDELDTDPGKRHSPPAALETTKEAHDDGGEVVEGEEDTVIY